MSIAHSLKLCVPFAILFIGANFAFAQTITDSSSVQPEPPNPSEFSFTQFQNILGAAQVQTVSEAIQALRDANPGWTRRWTALYHSNSIQDASFQYPRTIVTSPNGELFFAFNGHSSQKGFATLEIMTFNQESGYEFRQIHFPAEGKQKSFVENEIDKRYAGFTVSKANPQECRMCHGMTGSRSPIWDPYPHWPGAYGSIDDILSANEKINWEKHLRLERPQNARYLALDQTTKDLAPSGRFDDGTYRTQQDDGTGFPDFFKGTERNLHFNLIFSYQGTVNLIQAAKKQGTQALDALWIFAYCKEIIQMHSSSNPSTSLGPFGDKYQQLANDQHRNAMERSGQYVRPPDRGIVAVTASLAETLSPFYLTPESYFPMQIKGAYAADGGGGFSYLSAVHPYYSTAKPKPSTQECLSYLR